MRNRYSYLRLLSYPTTVNHPLQRRDTPTISLSVFINDFKANSRRILLQITSIIWYRGSPVTANVVPEFWWPRDLDRDRGVLYMQKVDKTE